MSISHQSLNKEVQNLRLVFLQKKAQILKKLGSKNIINRSEFEGETKLLGKAIWDGVVDTVGGNILSNAISQTKPKGIVALCGNASSNKLNTNVLPFILRAVKLWGVDSVNISKKRKDDKYNFNWK